MNKLIKKVISASAGTGKTYRLSLEFIAILVANADNPDFHFSDIFVITFTKKATAEIRERVINQLFEICQHNNQELIANLASICPVALTDKKIKQLEKIRRQIITHRHKLHISTIDSFINNIFTGIIAPYYNINQVVINNDDTDEIIDELLKKVITPANKTLLKSLFMQSHVKDARPFIKMFESVVGQRALFQTDYYEKAQINSQAVEKAYKKALKNLLIEVEDLIKLKMEMQDKPLQNYLKKDYGVIWDESLDFVEAGLALFSNYESIVTQVLPISKKDENICFWHGNKVRSPHLKEASIDVYKKLCDWLYLSLFVPQHTQIVALARKLLADYDDIRFRERVFSTSDINYYTYELLQTDAYNNDILNIFYEHLSARMRYLLIDEFQDTSVLQWNILAPIISEIISGIGAKSYGGVIMVGDEKQAIYAWRGGERELLLSAARLLGNDTQQIRLTTCYRSHPLIIEAVNNIFTSSTLANELNFFDIDWQYEGVKSISSEEKAYFGMHFCRHEKNETAVLTAFCESQIVDAIKNKKINPASTAVLAEQNKTLDIVAQVLAAHNIPYKFQSKGDLLDHVAIYPLCSLMKFAVLNDIHALLEFARSDLVLATPLILKELMCAWNKGACSPLDLLSSRLELAFIKAKKIITQENPLEFVRAYYGEFNLPRHYQDESANLQIFLEKTAEFGTSQHSYTQDLGGFLQYCKAAYQKNIFAMSTSGRDDIISLMSIHKSKGLEFETVFAVFPFNSSKPNDAGELVSWAEYNDDYQLTKTKSLFTYSYKKVLKNSVMGVLEKNKNKKLLIEKLNTYYVALTRAKRNMIILCTYADKKDTLKQHKYADHKSIAKSFLTSLYQVAVRYYEPTEINENYLLAACGELATKLTPKVTPVELSLPVAYFKVPTFLPLETPTVANSFAEFRRLKLQMLKGTVVHDYLANIKYAKPAELLIAGRLTRSRYGAMLSDKEIDELILRAEKFISDQPVYFAREWDKVYTEYSIFCKQREYRLDRLLINTKKRLIWIVDYKTGAVTDEQQLDNYQEILAGLAIVKADKYTIQTEFVEIK